MVVPTPKPKLKSCAQRELPAILADTREERAAEKILAAESEMVAPEHVSPVSALPVAGILALPRCPSLQ